MYTFNRSISNSLHHEFTVLSKVFYNNFMLLNPDKCLFAVRCAIWYHLHNLKNVKNTYGGVLSLVKSQAEACNFTKINTPPWVFSMFFKLYKWYQIAQRIAFMLSGVDDELQTDPVFRKLLKTVNKKKC